MATRRVQELAQHAAAYFARIGVGAGNPQTDLREWRASRAHPRWKAHVAARVDASRNLFARRGATRPMLDAFAVFAPETVARALLSLDPRPRDRTWDAEATRLERGVAERRQVLRHLKSALHELEAARAWKLAKLIEMEIAATERLVGHDETCAAGSREVAARIAKGPAVRTILPVGDAPTKAEIESTAAARLEFWDPVATGLRESGWDGRDLVALIATGAGPGPGGFGWALPLCPHMAAVAVENPSQMMDRMRLWNSRARRSRVTVAKSERAKKRTVTR